MEQDNEFHPDEMDVATSQDGRSIRLLFSKDSGERQAIIIPAQGAALLLQQLQKRTGRTVGLPASKGSLQFGETFSLAGVQIGPRPEGGAMLTLAIDLLDQGRVVTLPIELPPKDLEQLVANLSDHLQS